MVVLTMRAFRINDVTHCFQQAESFNSNDGISLEKCICLDNKWFFHTTCFSCNVKECSSRPDIKRPRSGRGGGNGASGRDRKKTTDSQDSEDSFRVEENWFYYSPNDAHAATAASAAASAVAAKVRAGGMETGGGSVASPSRHSRSITSVSSMESGATEDGFAAEGDDLDLDDDDDYGGGDVDNGGANVAAAAAAAAAGVAASRGGGDGSIVDLGGNQGKHRKHSNSSSTKLPVRKGKGLLIDLFYVDGKLLCPAHAGARNALIHSACGDNPASDEASGNVFVGAAPDEVYTGPTPPTWERVTETEAAKIVANEFRRRISAEPLEDPNAFSPRSGYLGAAAGGPGFAPPHGFPGSGLAASNAGAAGLGNISGGGGDAGGASAAAAAAVAVGAGAGVDTEPRDPLIGSPTYPAPTPEGCGNRWRAPTATMSPERPASGIGFNPKSSTNSSGSSGSSVVGSSSGSGGGGGGWSGGEGGGGGAESTPTKARRPSSSMMASPERNAPLPADTLELLQSLLHGLNATFAANITDDAAAAVAHNPLYTGPTGKPSQADGTIKDVKETRLSLPGAKGRSFMFTEHAAGRFDAVRSALSITDDDFKDSFAVVPMKGTVLDGGRSGSVIVSSADEKYVFKTATPSERNTLLNLLDDYLTHLEGNPQSFLAKFVGLYEIRPGGSPRTTCVIVMTNVLAQTGELDIEEVYDLKGSYVDRRTITQAKASSNSPGTLFTKVRKDMDLRRLFHLGAARAAIIEQLKKDVAFLASHKLMDYSMMIGVHNCHEDGECCAPRREAEATAIAEVGEGQARQLFGIRTVETSGHLQESQMIASGSDGATSVLFLGVIDLLQEWTLSKTAEAFVKAKVLRRDEGGLSAVNPERYAQRFVDFLSRRFIV